MRYGLLGVAVALMAIRLWRRRRRAPGAEVPGATRKWSGGVLGRLGGDVGLVARREVRERTKGRTFRIGTLIILLAVAAAVVIPVLRTSHHSQEQVGVVGSLSSPLRATVVATGRAFETKLHLEPEPNLATARRDLRSGRVAFALVDGRRIVVDQGFEPTDQSTGALLVRTVAAAVSVQAGLEAAGIPPARAAALAHAPPLPVTSLEPAHHNGTARASEIYGLILTYVLLTQYGTWILMGVVEEKSTRVVEVLLSTLRPAQLLAGKVIGIGAVALVQATLIVGVALGLGAAVGSDLLRGSAPLGIVAALVWLVLGYAFYCWVYAAGGSLAERQDQVQSLAFPLQLPLLFGYIVSFTALGSGNPSVLVKVLAYVPPTAPFAMPVLVGLGKASWWELAASAGLTVLATIGVARLAAAVYFRAILRTGGRLKLRQLFAEEAA